MKVKLDAGAYLPKRAHILDAGYDLRSPVNELIPPHSRVMIDTGVHVQIPHGYVGKLESKSGLMKQGVTSRGTIDSGYTGSIKAVLFNADDEPYTVFEGDKITQLVIYPIYTDDVEEVEELESTDRGSDGFGSTGR